MGFAQGTPSPQHLLSPRVLSRDLESLVSSSLLLTSKAFAHFLVSLNLSVIKLDQRSGVARKLPGEWVAVGY